MEICIYSLALCINIIPLHLEPTPHHQARVGIREYKYLLSSGESLQSVPYSITHYLIFTRNHEKRRQLSGISCIMSTILIAYARMRTVFQGNSTPGILGEVVGVGRRLVFRTVSEVGFG